MRLVDLGAEDLDSTPGLLHTDLGLEPPDHLVRMHPALSQRVGILRHHRDPDLGSPGQPAEAGGEHSHNRVGSGVQANGPAYDPGISAEASLPQPMPQQGDKVGLGDGIFFRKKDPPQLRSDSEKGQVLSPHVLSEDTCGLRISGEVERAAPVNRDFFKDLLALPESLMFRIRPDHVVLTRPTRTARGRQRDPHEPTRVLERERAQECGVYDAEYRRVRPDPYSESEKRNQSETRLFPEGARSVAQILKQGFHSKPSRLDRCCSGENNVGLDAESSRLVKRNLRSIHGAAVILGVLLYKQVGRRLHDA